MKIALDYDLTYSKDKSFFDEFLDLAEAYGHQVYIVTARHPTKDTLSTQQFNRGTPVIYCNGVAKKWHLHHNHDLDIDIWIDDNPNNIMNNSSASKEFLVEWRNSEEYKS